MDSSPLTDLPGVVAVVLKGWPRLSETFIAQELAGLEQRGLRLRLYSLRHPTDGKVHAINRAVRAPVSYLPEYLWREPRRVWRGWRAARRLPGYRAARAAFLRDLARDLTPNRGRRFGQALVLASELPADVTHLYAHFLHTPASVARYAAMARDLSWSASAHAKDIWTTPAWEKADKLADAAWIVTCTQAGCDHLNKLARRRAVELVHHGIDTARFPPAPPRGSMGDAPVTILSVGRAVAKKGHDDLLRALALLPASPAWRFIHVGGGPLLRRLKRLAVKLGVASRVEWRGSRAEDEVRAAYREADLFALASRVTDDGDRDGIPNVILEAMSQGVPVVATDAGAIAEAVAQGRTGVLAPQRDVTAIAAALGELIGDPARRATLGAAGAARISRDFPAARGYDRIAQLLAGSASCVSLSTRR